MLHHSKNSCHNYYFYSMSFWVAKSLSSTPRCKPLNVWSCVWKDYPLKFYRCPLLDLLPCVWCSLRHPNGLQFIALLHCLLEPELWFQLASGIRWRSLLACGGCGTPQLHWASLDYITAFILTNGISWWGILRVMGIKIPGLAPTRRLPCGAQQICCTCRDCCSNLYISRYRKQTREISVWRLIVLAKRFPGVRLCTVCAQVQQWPSWIWHHLQPDNRLLDDGELGAPQATERQHWKLILPALFESHCWICFVVSQRCSQGRKKRRTNCENQEWIKKWGWN